MRAQRLGLGTAQLGMDYGVSNSSGQTSRAESVRILELAGKSGMRFIDTAPSYGTSESLLGECLPPAHSFQIITKINALRKPVLTARDAEAIEKNVLSSLQRLRQTSVYGILFHCCADMQARGIDAVWKSLSRLKADGAVKKLGVSVYGTDEIGSLPERFAPDLVQLPLSVFDQRIPRSGVLQKLKKQGVEIHARSIFLQGVLLMNPEDLPSPLSGFGRSLNTYYEALAHHRTSRLEGALHYALSIPELDAIICGVNSADQLSAILRAAEKSQPAIPYEQFAFDEPSLLNPVNWSRR